MYLFILQLFILITLCFNVSVCGQGKMYLAHDTWTNPSLSSHFLGGFALQNYTSRIVSSRAALLSTSSMAVLYEVKDAMYDLRWRHNRQWGGDGGSYKDALCSIGGAYMGYVLTRHTLPTTSSSHTVLITTSYMMGVTGVVAGISLLSTGRNSWKTSSDKLPMTQSLYGQNTLVVPLALDSYLRIRGVTPLWRGVTCLVGVTLSEVAHGFVRARTNPYIGSNEGWSTRAWMSGVGISGGLTIIGLTFEKPIKIGSACLTGFILPNAFGLNLSWS